MLSATCWAMGCMQPGVLQLVPGCRARLWLRPQPQGSPGAGWWQRQGLLPSPRLPGSLLTSHVSCFLEMLVQLRSRLTGCRLMMPLSAWGVMDLHLLRSIFVHNLLSQHLGMRTWLKVEPPEPRGGQEVASGLLGLGEPSPGCRMRLLCLVIPDVWGGCQGSPATQGCPDQPLPRLKALSHSCLPISSPPEQRSSNILALSRQNAQPGPTPGSLGSPRTCWLAAWPCP